MSTQDRSRPAARSSLTSLFFAALALLASACSSPKSTGTADSGNPNALCSVDASAPPPVTDVLTQHVDVARTGANMSETVLTTSNVNGKGFGKLWSKSVDGLIYAQPLYVSNYTIGGKTRNVLIVATMHNSVYAFDADTSELLWGPPANPPCPGCGAFGQTVPSDAFPSVNIQKEVGILSTPVIDRENGLIYITNKTYFPTIPDPTCATALKVLQKQSLHVLSLATGLDVPGSPVVIAASVPGSGSNAGKTLTYSACMLAQRPAILLANGTIYLGFASHEDLPPWNGWVLSYQYDVAKKTLTQTHVFNTTVDGPDDGRGGIWMGGQGLVADSQNNIYAAVSNGDITANDGGQSYGMSFIKLSPELTVLDWYTPSNYVSLNIGDWDLGSGGQILIPGTHLIAGGGKEGVLYLADTNHMGHLGGTGDDTTQHFQASAVEYYGMYGGPVFWNNADAPRYYIWPQADQLRAYSFSGCKFSTQPVASSTMSTPSTYLGAPIPSGQDPVGALSVTSNGSKMGTGILWATMPSGGNPDHATVTGTFYAFDALTLDELWDSDQNASRDALGNWAKFVSPTVINGKAYVATHSLQVIAYGLLGGS